MEEVSLRAVKRAMPGRGRVRANVALLEALGIEDNGEIEVSNPDTGKIISVTIFTDELVGKEEIRISEEDLEKIGISNGETVSVRKKPAITEKIGAGVGTLKGKIGGVPSSVSEQVAPVGEKIEAGIGTLKKKTGEVSQSISEGVAPVGEKIEAGIGTLKEKAGEVSQSISEGVAPVGEKIHHAGQKVGTAFEHAIKKLKPGDASALKKLLAENKGEVRAITVRAPTAAGRQVQNLTLPPDVAITAVQRESELMMGRDVVLHEGDIVYVMGKEKSMDKVSSLLEG